MKKLLTICMLFCSLCNAEEYQGTGKVVDILFRASIPDRIIFYIDNLSAAGDCPTYRDHVVLSIPDDERGKSIYSLLLASYVSSKPIHVVTSDMVKDSSGRCVATDVRLNAAF